MTRAEIAAALVRMLDNGPQTLRELASCFDETPSEIGSGLSWLAGEGVVQSLGGAWRLVPGQVARGYIDPPDQPAGPAVRVAQAISEPSPAPADAIPDTEQPEPTESADMAKTKVCNRCEERKPLTAFSKNSATADGLQRTCRPCLAEYQAKVRKGKAPVKARVKVDSLSLEVSGETPDPAVAAKVEAAIAAEPAPLMHAVQAAEVSGATLDAFPVLGAIVIQQSAQIDGRRECHALLVARSDLRGLIDQLTRLV